MSWAVVGSFLLYILRSNSRKIVSRSSFYSGHLLWGHFLQKTHFWGSLGQQSAMRRKNRASKTKSFHLTLFSLPIQNLDQPKKFLTRKYTLHEGGCVIFRGSRAMAGIAGVVPLCYRTFVIITRAVYISTSSAKLVMLLQTFHFH